MQHLSNAPIVEAVIDIQVDESQEIDMEILGKLRDQNSDAYPDSNDRYFFKSSSEIGADGNLTTAQDTKHFGYLCRDKEKHRIAQFLARGFTFSEVKPYGKWKDFSTEAKRIWQGFQDVTSCNLISRVALRYINHIEIELSENEQLENYLNCVSRIPDNLPQTMSQFLNRVTIHGEEGLAANITTSMNIKTGESSKVVFLLDIDAYIMKPINLDSEDLWSYFELLRDFKNRIFSESITQKTLDILK